MRDAQRPVAIFGNGLGDHLLVLPALRALVETFAGRLGLVCMAGAPEIFFADLRFPGLLDSVIAAAGDDPALPAVGGHDIEALA